MRILNFFCSRKNKKVQDMWRLPTRTGPVWRIAAHSYIQTEGLSYSSGNIIDYAIVVKLVLLLQLTSSCCNHGGKVEVEAKHPNPTVIKSSQNVPVFINLNSKDHPHVAVELHKLQAKPMTMKMCKRVSRSILGAPKLPLVPYLLPLIPRTILPLFPNLLPKPTVSMHPLFPNLLPKPTVRLPDLLKPSPIAKLSRLTGWSERNAHIHKKLLEMKHKGTLSTSEYIRFTNLLMRL